MENDLQLYSQLLSLPLFQGLGKADLEEVVTHTKLGFHKFETGKIIVYENDVCNRLHFLLNGQIEVTTVSAGHSYQIKETITAPELLQPERLFGLTQHFSKTFKALSTCNILTVEKDEVIRLSNEFLIFRINLLNILSTYAQKNERMLLRLHSTSLESRIIRFFADRCLRPAGQKTIKIKMTQLALELNDSRRDVSKALHELEQKGILTLSRNFIVIEKIEDALQHTQP